jgi:hypothetical protein
MSLYIRLDAAVFNIAKPATKKARPLPSLTLQPLQKPKQCREKAKSSKKSSVKGIYFTITQNNALKMVFFFNFVGTSSLILDVHPLDLVNRFSQKNQII